MYTIIIVHVFCLGSLDKERKKKWLRWDVIVIFFMEAQLASLFSCSLSS